MSAHPGSYLLFLHDGGDIVARQGGKLITRAQFLAEIEELAEQLPDRSYIVNLCTDRYHFAIAWAAAMLRGQVTLLPSSHDAAAVGALCEEYPALYVLTEHDEAYDLPISCFPYPKRVGASGSDRIPAFPPDQIAAVLFTSGSTGRPNPSVRRWGRLVRASLAAGAALGVGRYPGAALVATVPHAHSYGLESAVMLPLQHGLLLTAERPFFPADVAAELAGATQPGILITTPVHLRALVGDAETEETAQTGFGTQTRAAFVLSATAPLSTELAARAEMIFTAPVFEIYGCSEAGQIATRRTIDGPVWRCLDGLDLRKDAAGTWASGPDEDDVLLGDEIELTTGGGFILQGRTADMVNIAGKRSSLGYLNSQLIAIDGVEDGVFLMPDAMPDDGAAGASPRLAAVAVAPVMDAAAILTGLRGRIDPAFLPRPLHVVNTLPRNALGKLPRAEVLRLVGSVPATEMPATDMPATNPAPILLRFPVDHPAGPGHFPGNPIIPGAVLLDELLAALFSNGWSGEIDAAKFHHPVRPGDSVAVACKTVGTSTRFECRLAGADTLVLSGVLRSASSSQ
jgi:acyl-coenzyme A synthetase/AMP-(fatty) acid ligase